MVLLWAVKWSNGVLLPPIYLLYRLSSMGFTWAHLLCWMFQVLLDQQVLKCPLEKIESESQTNQIVSMGKNSSGSARISVPPPPALHRRGDHHPAYHWPHVVQLAIHHDVSIWVDDVAALTDLSVHWSVETLDHIHPKPNCLLFSKMIILPVPNRNCYLNLIGLCFCNPFLK